MKAKKKHPWLVKAPKLQDSKRARLFVIVAREARRAVVFRRGPTRKTRLLFWNLRDDTFEAGQWFFGRIYERRCDLSPNGELLVYFAAKHVQPYYSWTAISRPPYLTALAFWPKGDCWGGGGLFAGKRTLLLNHRANERKAEWSGPGLVVKPLGAYAGGGEDDPIYSERLERDGWSVGERRQGAEQSFNAPLWIVFDPPQQRTLKLSGAGKFSLRVLVHGYHEKDGRNWVETADLLDHNGQVVRDFGRIDWIDADHNGDILISRAGRLERLLRGKIQSGEPKVVADLHDMAFEPIKAPEWAETWDRRRPVKR